MFRTAAHCSVLVLAAAGLVACGGSDDDTPPVAAEVGDTIVLTSTGRLLSFNRAAPATTVGSATVTGLASGDALVGIDLRPADGKLYGLGSSGTLYTLDPSTGVATRKSALVAAAGDDAPFTALSGTQFAVDFNPAADRLRVVSDTGQNLRIDVDTGAATTDGAITPATTSVSAAAYTNSFAGTVATQLYGLDVVAGRLVLQDPPNNGVVSAGVPLGITAETANGFDIDPRTNVGYAALRVGGSTGLYTINLAATGNAATLVAPIAGGEAVRGLALNGPAKLQALALGADNRLHAFDPAAPNTLTATVAITGLQAGDQVLGVDFRPKDGLLYALASGGRLYTVDPSSGAATLRATLVADAADASAPYTGLSAPRYTVDFNPVADRLRAIGSDGQNLRIAVENATSGGTTVAAGQTTTDGPINRAGAPVSIVGSAYTNNFAGAAATALYNLDENGDQLTLQNPPNDGTQVNVGALGLDLAGAAGFDIVGGANGAALAALRSGAAGPFTLYTVSLTTGATALYRNTSGDAARSLIGGAGGPTNLVDLAIRF
ncbi:DNA polymerase I [Pseudorhodoferax sp. Leaf274]|nr:DNA polymerase I [Pseudorhodoferax sp. Leaf274]